MDDGSVGRGPGPRETGAHPVRGSNEEPSPFADYSRVLSVCLAVPHVTHRIQRTSPCRSPVPFQIYSKNIYPLQISRFRMPSPSKSSVRKRAQTSFCSILCTHTHIYISTEHPLAEFSCKQGTYLCNANQEQTKKTIKSVLSVYPLMASVVNEVNEGGGGNGL